MNREPLHIQKYSLCHTIEYESTPVLTYDIAYPHFTSCEDENVEYLNSYYEEKAYLVKELARRNMYPLAVEQYRYSAEHQYPIMKYEVQQSYTVTDNRAPILSLYYDQYQYTGGAHGNTVRYSNVWNRDTKSTMQLGDFFPNNPNYREDIITAIEGYISREMNQGTSTYFDDYRQNVMKEFNENNFYVTPDGIVVYFQQYEIAPYSSGIPQFLIPFKTS